MSENDEDVAQLSPIGLDLTKTADQSLDANVKTGIGFPLVSLIVILTALVAVAWAFVAQTNKANDASNAAQTYLVATIQSANTQLSSCSAAVRSQASQYMADLTKEEFPEVPASDFKRSGIASWPVKPFDADEKARVNTPTGTIKDEYFAADTARDIRLFTAKQIAAC